MEKILKVIPLWNGDEPQFAIINDCLLHILRILPNCQLIELLECPTFWGILPSQGTAGIWLPVNEAS